MSSFRLIYSKEFLDLHKVPLMKSVYIVNTANLTTYKTYDLGSMTTKITFDKGAVWDDIPAPYSELTDQFVPCIYTGCVF